MSELPRACQRVADAAAASGVKISIQIMSESTRTADEAAAACNAEVGQIVKSLVFQGKTSGAPILLLVSGANRVDEKQVSNTVGERIRRATPDFARKVSGFAIGGIPPFGHDTEIVSWMDEELFRHSLVFAAAGMPNAVFGIEPASLCALAAARPICVSA